MSTSFSGPRRARRCARAVASTATALAAAAALAAPAGAVVNGSHVVAAIPKSSTLELSGYTPTTALTVQALRNGVVLGTATTTTDGQGNGGVNPVDCWQGFTPELLPGDVISVAGDGATDTMTVTNVDVTSETTAPGHVFVHGVAVAPGGGPYDAATFDANVQARISRPPNQALFDKNGRNTLRAGAGKFDGTIAYDAPGSTSWTADFALDAADMTRALSANSFEGVFLVGLSELTIGRLPVPAGGACPPVQRNAVTGFNEPAVNVADAGAPLSVRGFAQADATAVSVAIADGAGHTVTTSATPSAGTWSTPGVSVAGLSDGALTATPTITTPAGSFAGAAQTILKDLVAPPAPVASLSPGTYPGPRSVSLGDADPTATVRFNDLPVPATPLSPRFVTPLLISQTTTLNAIAVDPAGNTSPAASFAYTIAVSGGGGAGVLGGGAGVLGGGATGGAGAAPGLAVRSVSVRVLPGHSLRVALRLPSGAKVVRLRVFRARRGRPTGAPLLTAYRAAVGGRLVVSLRGRALRNLRPGRYVLEVRTGPRRSALGAASRRVFAVG